MGIRFPIHLLTEVNSSESMRNRKIYFGDIGNVTFLFVPHNTLLTYNIASYCENRLNLGISK